MKREVSISLFTILILVAVVLTVSYLRINPTGFAIFQQQAQTDFNLGNYSGVLYNGSAVVLSDNQTNGTYTSQIFDAGNSSTWNNLTWGGSGSLVFYVRNCSASDCSDANFSSANLTNLNLTGRYFQYNVLFDNSSLNESLFLSNVLIDYSVIQPQIPVSVSVSQPAGAKSSISSIPIEFNAFGNSINCSYNLQNSSGSVIANTTLANCENSSFNVLTNGSYTFNLYVTGSSGSVLGTSAFVVTLAPQNTTSTNTTQSNTQTNTTTNQTNATSSTTQSSSQEPVETTTISIENIPQQDINQGETKDLTLSVQNTGTTDVSACALQFTGDSSSWVSTNESIKSMTSGASASYVFSLHVPEDTTPGMYTIGSSISCSEVTASQDITVNVSQKKLDLNITKVQRTSEDNVRVDYSLKELSGSNQDVQVFFYILDNSNTKTANASQNNSVDANKTGNFRINIPINSSLEGNLSLEANFNSEIYSSTVLQPITLGAPISGFAIFENLGTGSVIIPVIIILAVVIIIFVVRKLRKPKTSLGKNLKK